MKKGPNKLIYQDSIITKFLIESPTYGNFEVIIDTEDYEKIKCYRWQISFSKKENRYVRIVAVDSNNKIIKIHQLIMNDKMIDHKNCIIFDNRKENLRKCTISQNNMNKDIQNNNTSGYKGVSWDKSKNKWEAYIQINSRKKHLGRYNTKEEAAQAYNEAAIKYHGEFARLNIIKDNI